MRLRTTYPGTAIDFLIATGFADPTGNSQYSRRSMMAELGFIAMPSVVYQLNDKAAADLWLPMTADGDTLFDVLAPSPKDATSVLGLLLRNSALRIAADATNEFIGLDHNLVVDVVARQSAAVTIANLPAAAGLATTPQPGFTAETTVQDDQTATGKDVDGTSFTVGDRLADIINHPASFTADLTRYFNSDALAAFRDSLEPLAGIATARRAVLTGEIIDCASHRYDAWMTSLATARLAGMQARKPGIQLGAWVPFAASSADRRPRCPPRARPGGHRGLRGRRWIRAGTLAAPREHGRCAQSRVDRARRAGRRRARPFATGLESDAVRRALVVAEGMRNGQQLGALLGTSWSVRSTTLRGSAESRSTGSSSSCGGSSR